MTRFREGQPYDSPPAYSGKIDLDGIWNVPLAQIERDRPPTWYFAIGSMPGTFVLEPGGCGKGGKVTDPTLVFTLQLSVRVCCCSWEMGETHILAPSPDDAENTWRKELGGGRHQVLKFVSERQVLMEWWSADGTIEWTRTWSHLGG